MSNITIMFVISTLNNEYKKKKKSVWASNKRRAVAHKDQI